jgi:hypothetical protein
VGDAWVNKTEPPEGKMGFGYMLQGGATPSNLDTFATKASIRPLDEGAAARVGVQLRS